MANVAQRVGARVIAVPTIDNGTEVVWGEHVQGLTYRVLSVPVFAYGVSRGTLIAVTQIPGSDRLLLESNVVASEGATIRVYATDRRKASDLYLHRMIPDLGLGEGVGPATFYDPDIVALHIRDRERWAAVGRYCDLLVAEGALRLWE